MHRWAMYGGAGVQMGILVFISHWHWDVTTAAGQLVYFFMIKKSGIRNYYYTVSAKSHIGMIQLILSVAVVVHELTPVADPLHSVEQQAGRTGVLPRLDRRRGVLCYCGK